MNAYVALGSACLLIRLGLALYGAGVIRSKNAAGAVLRTMRDLCAGSLAFWAVGAAILTQWHGRFVGLNPAGLGFGEGSDQAFLFFMLTVVLIGTGIASGATAERARFGPMTLLTIVLAGLIVPLGANWARTGWLARLGFIDVAGGAWLHVSGAACAAAAALAVGPRTGKYNRDGSASMIPGHNLPLAGAGALAMLAGWVPYVVGCALNPLEAPAGGGSAAAAVVLAGAAAGAAAMLMSTYRYGKADVVLSLMGFLGGLTAIAAGAGRVPAWAAVLIGAVAGVLVPLASIWLDLLARLDDPAGAIAVHGIGGAWGTLAAGLLVGGATAAERLHRVGIQVVGIVAIALLAAIGSAAILGILRAAGRLRATEADEFDGLDLAEHDIAAYPDFQQTTIKSYHLREA